MPQTLSSRSAAHLAAACPKAYPAAHPSSRQRWPEPAIAGRAARGPSSGPLARGHRLGASCGNAEADPCQRRRAARSAPQVGGVDRAVLPFQPGARAGRRRGSPGRVARQAADDGDADGPCPPVTRTRLMWRLRPGRPLEYECGPAEGKGDLFGCSVRLAQRARMPARVAALRQGSTGPPRMEALRARRTALDPREDASALGGPRARRVSHVGFRATEPLQAAHM